MTTPNDHKKTEGEGNVAAQVGDNRRAGDTDGNKAVANPKSPGVTEPEDQAPPPKDR